ncbi:hypothetical protein Gohar_026477, partial [Gossypium harknessii]|nr:hypothetical protein [Gossypium harknessii]
EVQNLGTYLGPPLLHNRVTNSTLSFLVDKVRRKLQNWDIRISPLNTHIISSANLDIDCTLKDLVKSDDEVVARDTRNASAGGMLWGQLGNWIMGFNRYLGKCSPFEAELWGILDELFLLLNEGYKRETIQTDNLDMVQALTDIGLEDSGITLLRRLRRIMSFERQ